MILSYIVYVISHKGVNMRILFCHGKEGNPGGTKASMIKENFGTTVVPRLTNSYCHNEFLDDLITVEALAVGADVLIGSSRGGALVAQARTEQRKILIAPAWKKFGAVPYLTKNDVILHSKKDDVVPYEDSAHLANMFGCRLIECGSDHRMSDKETLTKIKNIIQGK